MGAEAKRADRLALRVRTERDGGAWHSTVKVDDDLVGWGRSADAAFSRASAIRKALFRLGNNIFFAKRIPAGIDIRIVRARAKKAKG